MQFFAQDDSSSGIVPTELKVETAGLLNAITDRYFKFTAVMVHKILALLDPPKTATE